MSEKLASEISVQICLLFDQALDKIDHCLAQLDDEQLWARPSPELNSVGNLLLHVCGNLRQWCVTLLNDLPDDRDREAEFTTQKMPRDELQDLIRQTMDEAKTTINRLSTEDLMRQVVVQEFELNVMNAVLHTATHFQGHTHQIILLTRLQKKDGYQFHWTASADRHRVPM